MAYRKDEKGHVGEACPDCNGGEIDVPDLDEPSGVRKEECPRCKGTGEIEI